MAAFNLSIAEIERALSYCHSTEDLEADWERDLDEIAALEAAHRRGEHRAPGTPGCSICDELLTTILETIQEEAEADAAPDPVFDWDEIRAAEDLKQQVWESETIHEGFSIAALRVAFGRVQDVSHWKNPVAAPIPASEREITRVAVAFFTGSVARFSDLPGGRLLVEANGYYADVGA